MRVVFNNHKFLAARLGILVVLVASTACGPAVAQDQPAKAQPEQVKPERFWLAGRYDGNRVIVYFDAVKFEGALASSGHEIAPPIAMAFFNPVRVPAAFAARFQKESNSEHFALGDKYDLLLDGGLVRTVTLSTLVGAETDEEVGNDSFLGALATLDKESATFLDKNYYVVRRHLENQNKGDKEKPPNPDATYAYLEEESLRFDVQTQIVDLLTQRMKALATDPQRRMAERTSPVVQVQSFRVADGTLRYYASAEWHSGTRITDKDSCAVAAWLAPQPTLHILAMEAQTFGYVYDEPKLLNVIDLGGGRTGMIVTISAGESIETGLFEYHDGTDLKHMRLLQSIAAGE
jgi:hypothetical protein